MLVDSKARAAALNLESKLVKAPAGSGKTGLLTNYYLKLLGVVEHPREIQAMTFTNKAAKEMSERIISSLERVKKGFTPTNDFEKENVELAHKALANSQARGWNIESNVNMLQIGTIDSFCKKILVEQVGNSQGQLATRNISSDPHILYQRAVTETLALYPDAKYGSEIQRLVAHFGNKLPRVEKLLIEMLESRERWIPVLFMEKNEARETLEGKRAQFLSTVLGGHFNSLGDYESELQHTLSQLKLDVAELVTFTEKGFSNDLIDNGATFKALNKLLSTSAGKPKQRFTKNDGVGAELSKESKAELVDMLKQLSAACSVDLVALADMPSSHFKDTEWELLKSIFSVMPILLAKLSLTFKAAGEVDFTEIALNAVRALDSDSGDATSGAIYKSQSIKHILCDEFQDSNDTQLIMLKLLTESWSEDDSNTLFLVGDAMQSLYGFRGANVNVFMEAEKGIGNIDIKTHELTSNFRSSVGVVGWVNDIFCKAFPVENDLLLGACKYTCSSAVKMNNDIEDPVELHGFIDDTDGVQEANFILDKIRTIQVAEPDASIAVLGRTRSVLKPIMEVLNKTSDVSALTVNVNKIAKEPLCIIAIALARVLIDDLDKLAWVTVLNSGLVGMTHKQIESILNLDTDPYLALSDDRVADILSGKEYERFCYAMNEINMAIEDKRNKDFDLLLEGIWYKLHGPSMAEKELDIENVGAVFGLFTDVTSTELSLAWLERQLERLYAKSTSAPKDGEQCKVEIMTIHNAKGLEFDYVFIPGMHKKGPGGKGNLFSWTSSGEYDQFGVMACSESIGIKSLDVGYHKFLGRLKAKREQQELSRLVYVAVTRAIKKAVLTGKVTNNVKGEKGNAAKGSMFAVIESAYNESLTCHAGGNEKADQESIKPIVRKIDADLNLQLPSRDTLAAYRGGKHITTAANGVEWSKPVSKIEGAVINQVIEQINRDGIDNWNEKRVDQYSRVILASLKQHSLERDQLISSVTHVKNETKALLKCEVFQALCSKHKVDNVELSMAFKTNRKIHTVRIDKGFISDDGVAHIVGWKSAALNEGQSMDNFINSQISQHKDKLNMYREAYKEISGAVEAESSLYFTKTNHLQLCS